MGKREESTDERALQGKEPMKTKYRILFGVIGGTVVVVSAILGYPGITVLGAMLTFLVIPARYSGSVRTWL